MSKFNGVKTDNAKVIQKIDFRNFALENVDDAAVLEIYCGAGEMYRRVWKKAPYYMGIDRKKFFDERNVIIGDAMKALMTIDVSRFNIIDIDAYGSPYDVMNYISEVFSGSQLALVVTDGSAMDLRHGRINKGLRDLTRVDPHILKRSHKVHDFLIKIALENFAKKTNMNLIKYRIATGVTGSAMRYYCAIFRSAEQL